MAPTLLLRPATADDADWIVSQVPQLHEFGPPLWRTVEQMNAGAVADLRAGLEQIGDLEPLVRRRGP